MPSSTTLCTAILVSTMVSVTRPFSQVLEVAAYFRLNSGGGFL